MSASTPRGLALQSPPPLRRRVRARALTSLAAVLCRLPTPAVTPLLRLAGLCARGSRAAAVARQQLASTAPFAGWDRKDLHALERGVERHAVDQLAQVLRLAAGDGSWLDEEVRLASGAQHLEAAERGGAVVATLHIGHWEVLAAWLRRRGLDGAVVGRGGGAGDWLARVRARHGVQTVPQDASARVPLEVLRRGGTLGVLCDLDTRQLDGVHLPFLGRDALTMTAPAALARASGRPILPMCCLRAPDGGFEVHLAAPLPPPTRGARSDELLEVLTRLNAQFERWILAAPEQWAWHQPRWRTRPGEPTGRADPDRRRDKRARQG